MQEITRQEMERACRMYHTNSAAFLALRIRSTRLKCLAFQYGIELPSERKERQANGGRYDT